MDVLTNDISINTLAFDSVRKTYYGAFHHITMHIDSIFDFRRTNAMATHIQNVIDPASNAVVFFLIPQGSVTR